MLDWLDVSPWRALFAGMLLTAALFAVLMIAASIVGARSDINFFDGEW